MSKGISELHCTLCGLPAVLTVMETSKLLGANKAIILNYSNSAESKYGDANRVVGYGAAALVKVTGNESDNTGIKTEKNFL